MKSTPLRVAIFARNRTDRIIPALEQIVELLSNRNDAELVSTVGPDDDHKQIDADLLVVLGGDGAILSASRWLGRNQIPVLGINLGRLGFLADLQPEDFHKNIDAICGQKYQIVEHLMIECTHKHASGREDSYLALNEVLVHSGASLRMIDLELFIDGDRVASFSGDGLIVATPIGSTAHSLSAGGPILRQTLPAFVVTPINPHTLTSRPLVDSADCLYELRFPKQRDGVLVVIDGQLRAEISPGDEIVIRKAPIAFKLARFRDHSYYRTLHRKLGWGAQPRSQNNGGK